MSDGAATAPGAAAASPLARSGSTVVVTGGTGGIGLATATALAVTGARLVLVGRDPGRGEAARARVLAAGAERAELVLADLSSLAAVRTAVARLLDGHGRPDVLVANAGGLYTRRWETVDGVEASLAMNVLSPWVLVDGLLVGAGRTRVVQVSSGAVRLAGRHPLEDVQSRDRYRPMAAYARSKLLGSATALALGRRRPDVDVLVVDPGGAATDMTAGMSGRTLPRLLRPALPVMRLAQSRMTTERAARSSVAAATRADLAAGVWLDPGARVRPLPRGLRDPALGDAALAMAAQLAGDPAAPADGAA